MATDQLRNYVKENLAKGYTREALAAALLGVGWEKEDIDDAFSESVLNAPKNDDMSTPPVLPHDESQVERSALSPAAPPPQAQLPAQRVGVVTLPKMTHALPVDIPKAESKMKIFFIFFLLFFLLASGGASAYYFFVGREDPLDVDIHKMTDAMMGVESYTFDSTLAVNFSGSTKDDSAGTSTQKIQGGEGTVKLTLTGKGDVVTRRGVPEAVSGTYNIDGVAKIGALSVVLDGGLDARLVDGKFYVRIVKFPQIVNALGLTEELAPLKGEWISIDPSASSTLSTTLTSALPQTMSSNMNTPSREKALSILTSEWPLVFTKGGSNAEPVSGVDVTHLQFTVNPLKLTKLMHDLARIGLSGDALKDKSAMAALNDEINQFVAVVASTKGDISIGDKDHYLYRVHATLPIAVATSTLETVGSVDFLLTLDSFNKVAPISAPQNTKTIDKIYDSVMTSMSADSRDKERIASLEKIKDALARYFVSTKRYPDSLAKLVPQYLPKELLDPLDHKPYAYQIILQAMQNGKSYALGASLEGKTNAALASDADQKGTTLHTEDSLGCHNEANRYCYDIVP